MKDEREAVEAFLSSFILPPSSFQHLTYPSAQKTMMKMSTVEMQPPPNFHAAAPARIVRKGPCIDSTPLSEF
jgi:hypothetical protein